jgi:glycine hydroxymethyltransferase
MTTRGFGQEQARITAHLIADVLEAPDDAQHIAKSRAKVAELVAPFPVYGASVLNP